MRSGILSRLSIFLVVGLFAAAAVAQTAGQSDQTSPAGNKQDAGQQPPVKDCIKDEGNYKQTGGRFDYVMTLTNTCEMRIKCTVFVSVLQAKGHFSGHRTLTLGPRSRGDAAIKSYALKVAMVGGLAQGSRECKAL